MTTTWTSIHMDEPTLIGIKAFKEPGTYNYTVPAGAKWVRASSLGCGGQGDHWGGGGARARARVPVTAGDNLVIQVGTPSSASVAGDSFVKRNDLSVITYADRGRGAGVRGLAVNSVGDITQDGSSPSGAAPRWGGASASDAADLTPMGLGGAAFTYDQATPLNRAAGYGGGGLIATDGSDDGSNVIVGAFAAGSGINFLEFFDADPGIS